MNEEKMLKMLDLFIPKCPNFNIIYKAEELEHYKALDQNGSINSIEDILKLDDNLYVIYFILICFYFFLFFILSCFYF